MNIFSSYNLHSIQLLIYNVFTTYSVIIGKIIDVKLTHMILKGEELKDATIHTNVPI